MATKIKASNLGSSATTAITNIVTENSVDSALVNGLIDSAFTVKSTTDLSEGSNLYYTTSRGDSDTGDYIAGNRTYGNITTTGYIAGPATFTIDPAAVGDNTGTLIVAGNLQVDGTTTTINSTTLEVDDLNITLASGAANASAANGAGITVDGASATITYASASDAWSFNKNVGIGTSSPAQPLEIVSSTFAYARKRSTNGSYIGFDVGQHQSGQAVLNLRDNNFMQFLTNDIERLRIDSSGNVGIGGNTASATGFVRSLNLEGSDVSLQLRETTTNSSWEIGNDNAGLFRVLNNGANKLVINSTGNVGIGASSPSQELHIKVGNGAEISAPTGLEGAVIRLEHNMQWESGYGTSGTDFLGGIEFATGDTSTGTGVRAAIKSTVESYFNTNSLTFYTAPEATAGILERMRITSSGNLLVGTTSANFGGSGRGLIELNGSSDSLLSLKHGDTAGLYLYTASGEGRVAQFANLPMTFFTNNTERMRIEADGSVKIPNQNAINELTFTGPEFTNVFSQSTSGFQIGTTASGYLAFLTNNTERMRINSGGDICFNNSVANTASGYSNQPGGGYVASDSHFEFATTANRSAVEIGKNNANDGDLVTFRKQGTTVGSVSVTSSGTTYNTASDIRLKIDILPIADATDKLMAMNAVTHKWKNDPDADSIHGFIAQEMRDIVPEAVSQGQEENDTWSMDYGRITPVIVAALQDALKEIDMLKNRITELEAK